MPLIGYNYASGDYRRMRGVASFSWKVSLVISACFVALFFFFASPIVHRFIPDPETSSMGAGFLRVACLSVPLTAINFMTSYALQAMGKGLQSSLITLCRQGVLYIPAMLIMGRRRGPGRPNLGAAHYRSADAAHNIRHIFLHPAPPAGTCVAQLKLCDVCYALKL